jgi:hypothetical protein
MPISPTAGLARAALNFAEKYRKVREARNGLRDGNTTVDHAFALLETMTLFSLSCTSSIQDDAVGKLAVFFEITVGKLIDAGEMGWLNEATRRPFVLSCTNFLAARADAIATAAGTAITPHVLDQAAEEMISAKKPDCPLPPGIILDANLGLFGSACMSLGAIIHGQLVETR